MARIVTYVHRYKRPARKKAAVALKVPVIVTTPLPPRHRPTVTESRLSSPPPQGGGDGGVAGTREVGPRAVAMTGRRYVGA